MRELSASETEILDLLDQKIQRIEKKLEPFQELIDQKQRLQRTRATLLQERGGGGTGSRSNGATLTTEQVEKVFADQEEKYLAVADIAKATGFPDSTVRSHLHRKRDQKYHQKGDKWRLIGREQEE
jgi:Fic family protein